MPLRSAPLLALLLAVALGACDVTGTDDTALDVFTVDLRFDADDYRVDGLYTASFFSTDATVLSGDLEEALQTAGQGDLVMLYIDTELVAQYETDEATWTPLPLTRGFSEAIFDPDNPDPAAEDLFTTYVVSYEYAFEDENLYFNVVSSLPYTTFEGEAGDPRDFFDTVLPAPLGESADTIRLRLVVIPDELFFANGAAARVDLRDYEAVKAAYGLPD